MELTVLGGASSPAELIHARLLAKRHRSPDRFLPSSSFASCSTSPLQRSVAPAPRFDLNSDQLENYVDEELAWYDRTVIWSRGAQVYRTYSFDAQGEDVVKAAFVFFPSLAPTGLDQSPAEWVKPLASKGKAPATGTTPFGPFSTSQNCQWGAPRGVTATGQESPGIPAVSRLERTLVIFLRTFANIYLPSGETITTHLPFLVDDVWPLAEGGVVLQRSLERRERKRWARRKMATGLLDRMDHDRTTGSILDELVDLDDEVESLPRLYTLTTPRGEARPIAQTPSYEGGYLSEQIRITSPIRPLSSEMSIILVSSRPYPLIIAIDHEAREIVFYRWARIPTVSGLAANARSSPTMSPLAGLHPVVEVPPALPPKASRPSASRKRSSLGPSLGTDRRSSALGVGVADPLDRSNRRSSIQRQPRSSGIPEARASTGEILHATLELDDPFKAAASRPIRGKRGPRGLSSGGMLDVDRRVSIGRSDLNMSMDRMALNAAEEADLRETTMLFGLERDEEGLASEVVTERIWTCPLQDHKDIDAEDVKAFLSDTRSPQHALIHIHHTPQHGTPAALRTFKLQLDPSSSHYMIEPFQAFECSSAVPIISTREGVPDALALSDEGVLELLTSDGRNIPVTLPVASRAVRLSDPVGTRFTITFADGHTSRCSVDRRIQDWLPRQCFEMLSLVMPPRDFYSLKVELAVRKAISWPSFAEVLVATLNLPASAASPASPSEKLVHVGEQSQDSLVRRLAASRNGRGIALARTRTQLQCKQVSPEAAAATLLALHLVGEDCRLDGVRERRLPDLVPLIAQLSNHLRRAEWTDHWMRLYPLALTGIPPISAAMERSTSQLLDSFDAPPNILTCLRRCIMGKSARYPINSQLVKLSASGQWPELGDVRPLLLTEQVMSVFRALAPTNLTPLPVSTRASRAILLMVKAGLDETWVDRLTLAVAIPIREAMKVCQSAPQRDWPLDAYRLIGRSDQAMQSLARAGDEFQRSNDVNGTPIPISAILRSVQPIKSESNKTHLTAEVTAAPDVRFGADKRLQEVTNILQTHRTRTIAVTEPANADEQELTAFCNGVASAIAHRTMAVAVGRGIFSYGTKNAVITDAWNIPPIELSITLSPSKTSVKPTISQETMDWPNFHNGVAEALSISPNSGGIDSSWIVFNKPATFSASHGGFLLGLGLSGHLRCMQTWHAYPYLEPRHDFTTIGLLLGLGSSFAGSQDAMVTKVLSLHTHALLPLGSVELSASTSIQSAALVGLGLLYMGSCSYRMADAALKEIGRKTMPGVESFSEYQELYSFSASMAFGLIMLGQGGQASSQVERGMVDQLRQRIIGEAASLDVSQSRSSAGRIDSTYTAPGATLAIALMFMKTHRKDITDILEIPQTPYALDHVRPDLLLLRTLARALINWNDITPGMPWIESQLPACIQDLHKDHRKISTMGLPNELAYFNVIAGACFAIGLKYAGTATEFAHTTLLFFFGVFGKATSNSTMTYEGKIRRTAARQGLNLITIALAMVMSGTGELHVLRRLRVSHGQEGAGVNYGTHMAMHMACGILFLGHGRYTLGSSNAATAAMCIACFPRFSATPTDNKAYLQAYRHLWALAVEPRCLIGRDVDTHQTVYVPVKLRVMEGQKVKSQALIAPTLVAPFERLVSIEIDSPRYWPVTYDVRGNQRDRQNLIRTGTIFVKRKAAFLDYNTDPKGNRSIFVRAGTMSGSDLHYDLVSSASPSPVSDEDFIALTTFHSGEPHIKALGEILCRGQTSVFTKFAKFALLECISLDKASLFYHYISAFKILRAVTAFVAAHPQRRSDSAKEAKDAAAFFQHLRLLQTYYSSSVFDRLYAHSNPAADKRTLLFRPAFLATLVLTLPGETSAVVHQSARRGFYCQLASPPLETEAGSLALALHLGANNVPPLGLLHGLQSIVKRTVDLYREVGVDREDMLKIISGKIRETSHCFDNVVGGDGDEEGAKTGKAKVAIDNTARLWKLGSAIEALEAWTEEVEPVDL